MCSLLLKASTAWTATYIHSRTSLRVLRNGCRAGTAIISDETHSTGLLGNRGRRLVCKLELEREVVDRVHTFGKAMECSGGTKIPINTALYWPLEALVLSSSITREYLINYACTLIYTTAIALPSLASIKITYDFPSRGRCWIIRQSSEFRSHLRL